MPSMRHSVPFSKFPQVSSGMVVGWSTLVLMLVIGGLLSQLNLGLGATGYQQNLTPASADIDQEI